MKAHSLSSTTKLHQWWKPKAANLLAVLYLVMLVTGLPWQQAVLFFFPSFITILGIGSFGHIVNDWCDIEADRQADKPNRLAQMSARQRGAVALAALCIALLPWLVLPSDGLSWLLLALEFALLLAYAVPPFRLKTRGYLPVVVDATYAYALPAVLAAYTFFLVASQEADWVALGLLFAWQMALGSRHFLNHIASDRVNDVASGTDTLAVRKGNAFIFWLGKNLVLPLELAAFAGFTVWLGQYHVVLAIAPLGVWLLLSSLHWVLAAGRRYSLVTYRFSKMTLDWFYQDWWPLIPLVFLVAKEWPFAMLATGHLLLFGKFRPAFIFREVVLPMWSFIRSLIFAPLAMLIYPFYFLRKNSRRRQQTGMGEPLATNAEFSNVQKEKKGPAIAVVNINKSKYTETFVWQTVPRLRFRVFYLYGGELPRYDDDDRHFLSNWPSLQHWAKFVETVFRLEENYFLKNSISSYLQAKKIRLVLAQFGPTAVQMMPVARDAGIPLIVYFHGYDVFHKEIVARNLAGYRVLFREAAKIIVVSEIMLERLEQWGAAREKLVHLPAYVNLELFPFNDHAVLPPRFLAVGRFAETKSPHLTILAFQKVLKQIPGATLTLIGKDGGGELFEACLILIRALNLEQNVICKGVQTHEAVAEEMRNARVFVQHSLTTPENGDMEGKPVAVMEAMACGMPVVATRHSGIAELIEHEVSGLLVPEYDVEAMAAAMILLAQDDALARRLGRAAGTAIRQNPLISNNLNVLEEIIDQCIAGQVTP